MFTRPGAWKDHIFKRGKSMSSHRIHKQLTVQSAAEISRSFANDVPALGRDDRKKWRKWRTWLVLSTLFPMDPSTFLGSVWGIIYYNLEG